MWSLGVASSLPVGTKIGKDAKMSQQAEPSNRNSMRQRIIEEATHLFGQHGFEGTSIQAVADAVGIRKPSLLYHFNSKETLRREVLEALLSRWKNEIPRLLTAGSSARNRFSSTITTFVQYFLEDEDRARLMLREFLDQPETMRQLFRQHLSSWATLITDYIHMGQQLGSIKKTVDPQSYIIQIITMVLGTVALGNVAGAIYEADPPSSLQPKIAELVRIARDSLFVKQTPPPAEIVDDPPR